MFVQQIARIDFDKFQSVADGFIKRSLNEFGEILASSLVPLLFEKMAKRVTETVEIEGEILNSQLILKLRGNMETDAQVKNNKILIGVCRIVVKLIGDMIYLIVY